MASGGAAGFEIRAFDFALERHARQKCARALLQRVGGPHRAPASPRGRRARAPPAPRPRRPDHGDALVSVAHGGVGGAAGAAGCERWSGGGGTAAARRSRRRQCRQRERSAAAAQSRGVDQSQARPLDAGPGDHRGIVGAAAERRGHETAPPRRQSRQHLADAGLAATPPATTSASARRMRAGRCAGPGVAGRATTSSTACWKEAQMSRHVLRRERRRHRSTASRDRRLQAGEREVGARAAQHRPRQGEARGIAGAAARSTCGPPG